MAEATNSGPLPVGIRSRMLGGVNGLDMHMLEAGDAGRPVVLLLHGFPELAYSWRRVMLPLADAGYHVVAPDQRGYGGTTGWDGGYDADGRPFRLLNLVRDILGLVHALGCRSVAAVAGHDFGASVAAICALARPDVFPAVVLMSAPFSGPPAIRVGAPAAPDPIHAALARLDPPRKHYHWYYSTRAAAEDMLHPPQGLHDFLRAYYHHKSADWPGNKPFRLASWCAEELARMPTYYIMDRDADMPATVAPHMPSPEAIAGCAWLTDAELATYVDAFAHTGFGGALHWYRCRTEGLNADLDLFAGRTIDVPAAFIAGANDWGIHQLPGALEKMQREACTRMIICQLVEGAGHWVQQERPEAVAGLLREFLGDVAPA